MSSNAGGKVSWTAFSPPISHPSTPFSFSHYFIVDICRSDKAKCNKRINKHKQNCSSCVPTKEEGQLVILFLLYLLFLVLFRLLLLLLIAFSSFFSMPVCTFDSLARQKLMMIMMIRQKLMMMMMMTRQRLMISMMIRQKLMMMMMMI